MVVVVQCFIMCWCCVGVSIGDGGDGASVWFVLLLLLLNVFLFVLDVGINFVCTSTRTIDSLDVADDSTLAGDVLRKNDAIDFRIFEQRDEWVEEVPFIAPESICSVDTCICSGCTMTHVTLIMSLIFRLMYIIGTIQYCVKIKKYVVSTKWKSEWVSVLFSMLFHHLWLWA